MRIVSGIKWPRAYFITLMEKSSNLLSTVESVGSTISTRRRKEDFGLLNKTSRSSDMLWKMAKNGANWFQS